MPMPVEEPPQPQGPVTGTHPGAPNWKGVMSGGPGEASLRRYQVAVSGSNAPMPPVPLPPGPQEPVTGTHPGAPNWKTVGSKVPVLLRKYQVAVEGSKTPGVETAELSVV